MDFAFGNWTEKKKYTWDLEEQEVQFIGKVVKRESKSGQEKYTLEITQLNTKNIFPKIQVQMLCKENGKELFCYGSKVSGKGVWKEFSKARNDGTFDERKYRKSQGITAKIVCEKNNLQEKKQKKTWICKIKEEREAFCAFLEERLGEKESAFASAIFARRKK